jgi:hypothetical protein
MITEKHFTLHFFFMRPRDRVNYRQIIESNGEEILCSTIRDRTEKT